MSLSDEQATSEFLQNCQSEQKQPRKRAVLTDGMAIEIFKLRSSIPSSSKAARSSIFTAQSILVSQVSVFHSEHCIAYHFSLEFHRLVHSCEKLREQGWPSALRISFLSCFFKLDFVRAIEHGVGACWQAWGVSPKAVRDIWNRRTWRRTTRPLWTPQATCPSITASASVPPFPPPPPLLSPRPG